MTEAVANLTVQFMTLCGMFRCLRRENHTGEKRQDDSFVPCDAAGFPDIFSEKDATDGDQDLNEKWILTTAGFLSCFSALQVSTSNRIC